MVVFIEGDESCCVLFPYQMLLSGFLCLSLNSFLDFTHLSLKPLKAFQNFFKSAADVPETPKQTVMCAKCISSLIKQFYCQDNTCFSRQVKASATFIEPWPIF